MFVVEICADDACLHAKHVTLSTLLVFLQHLTHSFRYVSVADFTQNILLELWSQILTFYLFKEYSILSN